MSYGYVLHALYESGFALTEDAADHSPYAPGKNTFHAIVTAAPTACGHGRLVALSLLPDPADGRDRYDIDWVPLWTEVAPRPIYYREMTRTWGMDGSDDGGVCIAHGFGFAYITHEGHPFRQELRIGPDGTVLGVFAQVGT